MIVVSNASPLIILAKISHFYLLQRLFKEITISEEVWDEVVVNGAGLPGSAEAQQANHSGWIHIALLANSTQLAIARELGVNVPINMSQMTVSRMSIQNATPSSQQRQHWLSANVCLIHQ